jgi:hypothetical protein
MSRTSLLYNLDRRLWLPVRILFWVIACVNQEKNAVRLFSMSKMVATGNGKLLGRAHTKKLITILLQVEDASNQYPLTYFINRASLS